MNRIRLFVGAHLMALTACHGPERPTPSATTPRPVTSAAGPRPVAPVAPVADAPLDWGTRPSGDGPLYAIVDGMCVFAEIYPVTNGAVFAYGNGQYLNYETSFPTSITTAFVDADGITPDPGRGFGAAISDPGGRLATIGGTYPEHLYAAIDYTSRAVFLRELRVGSAKATSWRSVAGSRLPTGENLPSLFVAASDPIDWNDGTYLFATTTAPMSTGMPDADEPRPTYAFQVLSRDLTLVPQSKVPGGDLAEAMFGSRLVRRIVRLPSGEVAGLGFHEKKKLVRWSPTRPIDDVPFPVVPKTDPKFRAGKSRVVVQLDDALYVYAGAAFTASKLNAKLPKGFAWTVGPDDEIVTVGPSGAVLEESTTGAVREDSLPFAATFDDVPSGIGWGLAAGKGKNGSDALVRKVAGRWEVVELPAPPFGSDRRGPLKVASIVARDATDVFVVVQRSETGFGWKKPASFRVVYRTRRPREVLRCQDVRNSWTGSGTHRWAPAATDTCTTPLVVASFGPAVDKDPTTIATHLRGKTQFGETLPLVTFEGRGMRNLGIATTDMAKAKALAAQLSELDLRPEIACGKPTPVKTVSIHVPTGTLVK